MIMPGENDRVWFAGKKMNKQFGVFILFSLKEDITTIGKDDFALLGQSMMNVIASI